MRPREIFLQGVLAIPSLGLYAVKPWCRECYEKGINVYQTLIDEMSLSFENDGLGIAVERGTLLLGCFKIAQYK